MEDNSIFIDTNFLVYANVLESPFHQNAFDLLKIIRTRSKIWISRQILREYISAISKEDPLVRSVPTNLIREQLENFEKIFHVAEDNAETTRNLLTIFEQYPTKGRKIHDANIVATMKAYNIPTLLTQNKKDFERYSSLISIKTIEDLLKEITI